MYKIYPTEKEIRFPTKKGFALAIEKFLYEISYWGSQITSVGGYPKGTKVVIRGGHLAGKMAYISGFHLGKFRYSFHLVKKGQAITTLYSLTPISEQYNSIQYASEFADNGKQYLLNKGDFDIIDDSMRALSNCLGFAHRDQKKIFVIDEVGKRGSKKHHIAYTIKKEGQSHEVPLDELIKYLQELQAENDKK